VRKTENECVGCPSEMGCIGSSCKYLNVTRYYCDYCGEEATLYDYYDEEVCAECILKSYNIIEGSDTF
jgi:hypothetical protein